MSEFSLGMLRSWYDLTPDPDDLDLVQQAVDQHLPPGVTLGWEALLEIMLARESVVSFSFPNDHAVYFTGALETLCDGLAANTELLSFLPVPLAVTALDLSRPGWRWRLYSTHNMLTAWERIDAATRAEIERLAQLYQGPGTTDLSPVETWGPVVEASCLLALKTTAEAATRYGTPAAVHW